MAMDNKVTRPKSFSGSRQPSRLQRRAPAAIQIGPASEWNVAIPLLSPLVSPSYDHSDDNSNKSSPLERSSTAQINPSRGADNIPMVEKSSSGGGVSTAVFKKWQHPAAPFCYDSAPIVRPFVPV